MQQPDAPTQSLAAPQMNAPLSQTLTRLFLGAAMTWAGISHLTSARETFQAQVPSWFPIDADLVVLGSGVIEIALGLGLLFLSRQRRFFGLALALFFVLIFPGNIAQYVEGVDAFGLDTDTKRLVRLCFQPVLVLAAIWASGWWPRANKPNPTPE